MIELTGIPEFLSRSFVGVGGASTSYLALESRPPMQYNTLYSSPHDRCTALRNGGTVRVPYRSVRYAAYCILHTVQYTIPVS
jgi:hypothetical protein